MVGRPLSQGGGGGAAGAAQQVVQPAEFVVGEPDGVGDPPGQVGEAVAQAGAGVGEVDPDGALVGGAAFAADEALVVEPFEQRGQGAAVQLQGLAEVAHGGGSAVPQHAQDEVLRVGEAVSGESAAVEAGQGPAGRVQLEADHLLESRAVFFGGNARSRNVDGPNLHDADGSAQFGCVQPSGGDAHYFV